ncbi:MAG: MBL fold metallo-hydrolase [Clostridiaceae bacterium]|nr:MBL fold metallo-hydrolase [Clostridiaceae bacterium]
MCKLEDEGLRTDEIFNHTNYKDQLQVRFFYLEADSKAGDSILITTPDGVNMLIDAGIKDAGEQVIGYLKKLGIEKLEYVVASHFHSDHIGGLIAVINEFDIGEVMVNEMPYKSSLKKKLDEAISAKNLNVQFLKAGDTFSVTEDVIVEVINPEPEIVIPEGVIPEQSNDFVNNHSTVMRMTYKNNSFLFTGDIYDQCEKELVEKYSDKLKVDVLKVPHHGSDTSSSNEFISAVSPSVSVITSNASFSMDRYKKYRNQGSDVYITGIDGNVLVLSDGEEISVVTEKDRVGSFLK